MKRYFFDTQQNANFSNEPEWCFSFIPLKVKDYSELRTFYSELSRGEQILGSNLTQQTFGNFNFEIEKIIIGEKVLEKNYAPLAQEYLKKGCPRCLRAKIWTLVLGAHVRPNVNIKTRTLLKIIVISLVLALRLFQQLEEFSASLRFNDRQIDSKRYTFNGVK